MNFSTVPTWFWIAAGVLAFLWYKRQQGQPVKTLASPRSPANASAPAPAQIEITHVVKDPNAAPAIPIAPAASPLTQIQRASIDVEIAVTPVPPKVPGGSP